MTLLRRTHVRRWRKTARAGRPSWDERNRVIAGLIPAHSSVLDLGCGAQTLREHLKPGCRYQPCDIIKSSADVIVCDFNRGIYPEVGGFDYVVCSGVLEYVRRPREFVQKAAALGDTLILSYVPFRPAQSKLARLSYNWVNHFSLSELEAIFTDLGLVWTIMPTVEPGDTVYCLKSATREPR